MTIYQGIDYWTKAYQQYATPKENYCVLVVRAGESVMPACDEDDCDHPTTCDHPKREPEYEYGEQYDGEGASSWTWANNDYQKFSSTYEPRWFDVLLIRLSDGEIVRRRNEEVIG